MNITKFGSKCISDVLISRKRSVYKDLFHLNLRTSTSLAYLESQHNYVILNNMSFLKIRQLAFLA